MSNSDADIEVRGDIHTSLSSDGIETYEAAERGSARWLSPAASSALGMLWIVCHARMSGGGTGSFPIVIIFGADSGASGGRIEIGEKESSRGSDSALEGRTLGWPDGLEVSLVVSRVSDVSFGGGFLNSLHGSTKCPDGVISN